MVQTRERTLTTPTPTRSGSAIDPAVEEVTYEDSALKFFEEWSRKLGHPPREPDELIHVAMYEAAMATNVHLRTIERLLQNLGPPDDSIGTRRR